MPPKAKITRDMIIDAGFEIAREEGAENINARIVSNKLNCSTHPVMYHFATIENLKLAAFERTDQLSYAISDEYFGGTGKQHAWNWAELYSFCGG